MDNVIIIIRHGVKYMEMYFNTNTFIFQKYKYKYFSYQSI